MSDTEERPLDEMSGEIQADDMPDAEPGAVPHDQGEAGLQSNVLAYDFVHPTHRLNSHLPVLDVINEKLAKALTAGLVRQFRLPLQVDCEGTRFEKYQDFTVSLSQDVSIQRIRLDPVQGNSLLIIGGDLIFTLVDAFFGGAPAPLAVEPEALAEDAQAEQAEEEPADEADEEIQAEAVDAEPAPEPPPRRFTPTEQRIIDRVTENVFSALVDSWSSIQALNPRRVMPLIRSEVTSPANPSAVVVCSRFRVRLQGAEGDIHLMIPYASLEPLRHKLSNEVEADAANDQVWRRAFMRQVLGCEVDVNGTFAETRITMRQLMNLKVGDFIPLGQVQSVEFSSEGVPLFDAAVGVSNGMVSASVTQWHERHKIKKQNG
ncbi:FliM/FliN family flagellar motor switch protein [Granulosicoccaceae sp. 1_MG-2023]|nr:FliM/FliN family flagellar motor switch protein [Granulosicoccaceae sp. 1_MG-2023]